MQSYELFTNIKIKGDSGAFSSAEGTKSFCIYRIQSGRFDFGIYRNTSCNRKNAGVKSVLFALGLPPIKTCFLLLQII